MIFNDKYLDRLREGFKKHDFTKEIALPGKESTVPVYTRRTLHAQSKDLQKCIVRKEKYMLEKYILKTEKSCITNG